MEGPEDIPRRDERIADVAILDMNHGWPNLGHDCLVHAVQDAACDLIPVLQDVGLSVRAVSYEVRRRLMIPEEPGGRFALYLGTGGPGDLDPRKNDGRSEGAQGIAEDPGWEPPLFHLFDAILGEPRAALLAVCHTFGVLCRWSGAARAVLRGPERGGKSSGVLENILTPEAQRHPWFSRFSRELRDGARHRVVDNRLFDLIPERSGPGVIPLAHETQGVGGAQGEALTMLEFAREPEGSMSRILGVNHHPEIVDRERQMMILDEKLRRGEVTEEWYRERLEILTWTYPDEDREKRLRLTSHYTLLGPLRYFLTRQVRLRSEALGHPADVHEDRILEGSEGTAVEAVVPIEGSREA